MIGRRYQHLMNTNKCEFNLDFWSRAERDLETGCLLWQRGKFKSGYGAYYYGGRNEPTHRLSFYFTHDYWPEPQCLHSCDIKHCIEPTHLRAGTQRENSADASERGQAVRGEDINFAKLTKDIVREIRDRHTNEGIKQKDLAEEYGISKANVCLIVNRKSWKHI